MTARPRYGARMSKIRVIPCLDVAEGRIVKGVKFVDLIDAGDPVESAAAYDAAGADEICLLDIHATSENRATMHEVVTAVAARISVPLIVGGGVRSADDMQALLDAGAAKVSFGSAAIADPAILTEAAERFGSERVIAAIDARTSGPAEWEVLTHGGHRPTGLDPVALAISFAKKGAGEILLTSLDRDGTRAGFNIALTRAVADGAGIPVIASGGVGALDHFVEGVTLGHASGVLAASVFHFGAFSIREVKEHMAAAGIPVDLS